MRFIDCTQVGTWYSVGDGDAPKFSFYSLSTAVGRTEASYEIRLQLVQRIKFVVAAILHNSIDLSETESLPINDEMWSVNS
jgi:hypothetical protein